MLKVVLSLRRVMLVASFGAVLGAALMFWLGFAKLPHSAQAAFMLETTDATAVPVGVMGATDAFLFGVVLIIFAVAIAFGFVFELPEQSTARLPAWMRVNRPSTTAMTCQQAAGLVYARGAIVLGTGGYTYDRFVRDQSFCQITEATERAWVPTR